MVKTILKQNGITLLQFANDLNISRPTLDVYIKNYDACIELSNSVFQKIFDFLFEDELDKNEFREKYEYVKSYYGNKEEGLSSLHSKSISSADNNNNDEYNELCDRIMDMLVKSKDKNKYSIDKLKSIEKVLLADNPEFYPEWSGERMVVFKIKSLNVYRLCLKMDKSKPDGFKPEDVYFEGNFKYCKLVEDTNLENLIKLAENMEKSI